MNVPLRTFAVCLATVLLVAVGCTPPSTIAPVEDGASASIEAGARAYRWAAGSSQPIRLYVQQRSDLPGFTAGHKAMVDRAVRAWSAGGAVDVARTGWENGAGIRVRWTNALPPRHPGVTMLKLNRRGELVQADVWINVTAPPLPGASPDDVLYAVIAHEVGHALGMPHVAQKDDLMYAVLNTFSVTRADLDALKVVASTGSLPRTPTRPADVETTAPRAAVAAAAGPR